MLNFQVEDKNVEVMFWHVTPEKWDEYGDGEEPKAYAPQEALDGAHGITECAIVVSNNGNPEVVKMGCALCSVQDNFDRKIGRKISLTRALESFDKDFRTA